MRARLVLLATLTAAAASSQTICAPTPAYSRCELVFDLDKQEIGAHPNPYVSVQLHAEIRSPRYRTIALPAYWDGGGRMVIRFAPTGPGDWEFRITSNIARFNGKQGVVTALESADPGFVRPANGHHWQYTENKQPHLWMGDTSYGLAWLDEAAFRSVIDTRAAQKFTHLRGYAIGRDEKRESTFSNPDKPDPAFFRTVDERLAYINSKGIVFDMILGHDQNHLAEQFPTWQQRERFIRYIVARYSAFNITWQIVQEFEEYSSGRELLKEIGTLLKKMDPYQHPRSTHAVKTSSPLLGDGWMDYVVYQSSDDNLGAIEHQLFAVPFVNAEFGYEDSGAGKTHDHHVDSDTFRRRLWNSTMNGQYPTFGNTGIYGSTKIAQDVKYLESPGTKSMTVWFEFFEKTRYWELEPYFDVDGARCIALPGVEYILYVEKPSGPVEIRLEKHDYEIRWLNPATGEILPLKNFKSERHAVEPPDNSHDWVLHISRDGRKEGMLRSYKFESRPFLMQEAESGTKFVPYEIAEPASEELSISKPAKYSVKLRRETRATRLMMYLWTGEVAANNQGYRIIGTGSSGTMQLPKMFASSSPSVVSVRVYGLNANGKLYFTDRIYRGLPLMRILALDTTGTFGSIALYENGIVEEIPMHAPDGYGQVLFAHIARLLERHDWPVNSITCFAAANGPGSFTGVRVGIAAVKALAEATQGTAIGVSNLQALAAYGSRNSRGALMDARRGEVYAAVYDADLREICPEVVTQFPAWLASLERMPEEIVSPEINLFQHLLPKDVSLSEQRTIASAVARITACRLDRGDPGDPLTLEANYVRRSDAELLCRD